MHRHAHTARAGRPPSKDTKRHARLPPQGTGPSRPHLCLLPQGHVAHHAVGNATLGQHLAQRSGLRACACARMTHVSHALRYVTAACVRVSHTRVKGCDTQRCRLGPATSAITFAHLELGAVQHTHVLEHVEVGAGAVAKPAQSPDLLHDLVGFPPLVLHRDLRGVGVHRVHVFVCMCPRVWVDACVPPVPAPFLERQPILSSVAFIWAASSRRQAGATQGPSYSLKQPRQLCLNPCTSLPPCSRGHPWRGSLRWLYTQAGLCPGQAEVVHCPRLRNTFSSSSQTLRGTHVLHGPSPPRPHSPERLVHVRHALVAEDGLCTQQDVGARPACVQVGACIHACMCVCM